MTHNQAGPACAQILGFLGADVIKLEEPKGGDVARTNMRDRTDSDSLFFLVLNANKRSLTLNLKTEAGQEAVPAGDRAVRRAGGEFRTRRAGSAGARLQGAVEAEPAPDLRDDQGLRHLRPVQRLQELRADRAGDGRRDERHRLSREPADLCDAGDRRFRHRHAHGDRHPGGAAAAASDRQGPARRGVDAGCGGEPDPRQPARPSALRRADAAQRQPARTHRAGHDVCLCAGRTERLCVTSTRSRRCGSR